MITSFIRLDNIFLDIDNSDKSEIIKEMAARIGAKSPGTVDFSAYILSKEEKRHSTLKYGIALPRAMSRNAGEVVGGIALLKKPVEWGGAEPVRLVIMLAAPSRLFKQYLRLIESFMKVLGHTKARTAIMSARSPIELYAAIEDAERYV